MSFTDFEADFFVAQIGFNAETLRFELCGDIAHGIAGAVGHCHDFDLNGCKPCGESAGEMLGDNADEPFDRAENNAMNHDGAMLCAVRAGVFKFKPFGKLHVELNRAALPCSAETVRKVEVEFRAVERAVTLVNDVFLAEFGDCRLEGFGCEIPILYVADMVFGHCGKLDGIFKAESGINLVEQADDVFDFVLHLIPSHEDMGIILSEAANAEEAVQRT